MKVLVISHNSFSKTSNNGKTLEAIFSAFPSGQLAQLYFSNLESPDYAYCQNYFKVTDMDVLKSIVSFGKASGGIPDKRGVNKSDAGNLFNFLKKVLKNSYFLRDLLWMTGKWRSEKLLSWVSQFNPDAIFYLGGGAVFSHKIAVALKDYTGRPLVTYFTDDYIIYPEATSLIASLYRKILTDSYFKTISKSSLLFAIGDEMAGEYSRYFGKKFYPIMNSVEDLSYSKPNISGDMLQVSYFGGLHLGRWKMISRFAESLKGIVQVNVYSASDLDDEIVNSFSKSSVLFHGRVGVNSIHDKMLNSDMLLHVESDDFEYRRLTKLSVSTKIPEYLISGRPVIAYGPPELASMKVITSNDIGFFISSSKGRADMLNILEEVISNSDVRCAAGLKGYTYARNNFLKDVVSEHFKLRLYTLMG